MISPVPVVGAATCYGCLVTGFRGAPAASVGFRLPLFVLAQVATPPLARHRGNRNVQGRAKGACAAAMGTIDAACVLPRRIAAGDWPNVLFGLALLVVRFLWEASHRLRIAAIAVVGRIALPRPHPASGMVRRGGDCGAVEHPVV